MPRFGQDHQYGSFFRQRSDEFNLEHRDVVAGIDQIKEKCLHERKEKMIVESDIMSLYWQRLQSEPKSAGLERKRKLYDIQADEGVLDNDKSMPGRSEVNADFDVEETGDKQGHSLASMVR